MSNTQMHLPTDLVSIKVGRFEQSPYFDFYNNPEAFANHQTVVCAESVRRLVK